MGGAAGEAPTTAENPPGLERRLVLDDLEYDDSESPAIGLVPAGVSWEDVHEPHKDRASPAPGSARRQR